MVLVADTSALAAVLNDEPEAPSFKRVLSEADDVLIGTATLHEANCLMASPRFPNGAYRLSRFVEALSPTLIAFDTEQMALARDAYARFGRGSGHPAKLNMGDCFAYALAKATRSPLLFKGGDFIHTDVASALRLG